MPAVFLATCQAMPDGDEDGSVLTSALAAAGVDSQWVAWDDNAAWDERLVVIRSTWDYMPRRKQYVEWTRGVPRLANSADTVEWNTDKVYLHDLAAAGLPVVETTVAAPGETPPLPDAAEFVVKPSVGGGSRGVGRFVAARADEAHAHIRDLHDAGRTVLVQTYLDRVDEHGETALVYFDGAFSHAIRKGPMLPAHTVHPVDGPELFVQETIDPRVPDGRELEVGEATVAAVRERFGVMPLYARVDLLPGPDGPVLVELELTEPSLFLQYDVSGAAAGRFAAAIAARA